MVKHLPGNREKDVKITIIVPTYQERENLEKLLPKLQEELKRISHQTDVLVCDDNSPDGSGQLVRDFMKISPNAHLLTGNKSGYGVAVVRGLKYAIEKLKSTVIVTMDADFSHNPKDISKLLIEIEKGADFVIGSRYIKGGKISAKWGWFRRLNSKWGNRFARRIAGIKGVNDCTAGFRAIKTSLIKKLDLDSIDERGYSFLMRVLYEANQKGAKIVEVPVEFTDRKAGETKLGFSDILEFVISSFKLGIRRIVR